jgi:hypothetical protein
MMGDMASAENKPPPEVAASTSRSAPAAFAAGLLALACAVLAFCTESDLPLPGVLLFSGLALFLWRRSKAAGRLRGSSLAGWGAALAAGGAVLSFVLLPLAFFVSLMTSRQTAYVNMKRVVTALHNYAGANGGRLPPAAVHDKDGRPLLSWRVLVLPYLDGEELFRQFRLNEPWDSPHNLALLPRMPRVYAPLGFEEDRHRTEPFTTFLQVFVGRGTAFEGRQGLRLKQDFPDGVADTILVAEGGAAVPWTKPADLAYDPSGRLPPLGGAFSGRGPLSLFGVRWSPGFYVGMGDGSVRFETSKVREATLRDAITRDHGSLDMD